MLKSLGNAAPQKNQKKNMVRVHGDIKINRDIAEQLRKQLQCSIFFQNKFLNKIFQYIKNNAFCTIMEFKCENWRKNCTSRRFLKRAGVQALFELTKIMTAVLRYVLPAILKEVG